MNDYPRDLLCLGDKYMLYMPDKNIEARQGAYIFDPEKNTYTQILHFDEWDNLSLIPKHLIEKTNSEYSLINTSSSIIYNMKGSEILNRFQFDISPRQYINGYSFVACGETDSIIIMYWGYWDKEFGECDHVISCLYDKNTEILKIFRGLKNDINGKDGSIWSLNNQIVKIIDGELDKNGFELNPVLQIWHLKKINEMP
jgi:hypothetical protein